MGLMITPASKAAHVFLVNEGRARTGGRESPQKQVGVVQLARLVAAFTRRGMHRQQHHRIITVARDSGRLLYFGRVIYLFFLFFFFRPPNFRRPWADFRETLPHDAVCAEIVYLL